MDDEIIINIIGELKERKKKLIKRCAKTTHYGVRCSSNGQAGGLGEAIELLENALSQGQMKGDE